MEKRITSLVIAGLILVVVFGISLYVSGSLQEKMFRVSEFLTSATLILDNTKLTFSYPVLWGKTIQPVLDSEGYVVNNPYKKRRWLSQYKIDKADISETFVLSGFSDDPQPYLIPLLPAINVIRYPEHFSDDIQDGPGSFTAIGKQHYLIDPLVTIWKQRSLAGVALGHQGWNDFSSHTKYEPPLFQGAWWGNIDYVTDRIAVSYVENDSGDMRGVSFFDNSGQDVGFDPTYRTVLINPDQRVVLVIDLPVDTAVLKRFDLSSAQTTEQAAKIVQRGYEYLSATEWAQNDVSPLVQATKALARSVALEKVQ